MALRFTFPSFYNHPEFVVDYESPSQFYRPRFFVQIPFKYNFIREDPNIADAIVQAVIKATKVLLPERMGMMDLPFATITSSIDAETALQFFPFLFNYFVGSITVTRSRDDIGSATISLNFHKKQDIFYDSMKKIFDQVFFPVCPLRIYMQGRFVPDMVCVFTGFITEVSYEENPTFKTITISCNDAAKLLVLSPVNINPGIADRRKFMSVVTKDKSEEELQNLTVRLFSNIFTHLSYPTILKLMILGTQYLTEEERKLLPFTFPFDGIYNITEHKLDFKIFEGSSAEERATVKLNRYSFRPALAIKPGLIFWGYNFIPSRNLDTTTNQVFNSDYTSRWELIREASAKVFFELYATALGDFHSHPYRFNPPYMLYDFFDASGQPKQFKWREKLKIPPSVFIFMEDEILSASFSFNDSGYVTALDVVGEIAPYAEGSESAPFLILGEYNAPRRIMERMGLRYRREVNSLINNLGLMVDAIMGDTSEVRRQLEKWKAEHPDATEDEIKKQEKEIEGKVRRAKLARQAQDQGREALKALAQERANLINGALYRGSISMILRPELEVAKPCYIPMRDELFYIDSFSHNISVGSVATTTVNIMYGRSKKETFSFYEYLQKLHAFHQIPIEPSSISNMLEAFKKQKEIESKVKAPKWGAFNVKPR